jgi:hypothetical protein
LLLESLIFLANNCHPGESRDPDPRDKAMAISFSVSPLLGPGFRRDDKHKNEINVMN